MPAETPKPRPRRRPQQSAPFGILRYPLGTRPATRG
jgi:hypothetical protein